jgi:hypothetical protein
MLAEGQRAMGEALALWRRTSLMVDTSIKGLNLISLATSRIFLTQSHQFFKEDEEPLQADEWLNTLEQKFHLLRVIEQMKAEYATHQLQGHAGIWWSHHRSTLPENAQVTWNEFKDAFRGPYIPLGLMSMKHTEFMRLT